MHLWHLKASDRVRVREFKGLEYNVIEGHLTYTA
jgi:hypothetical protein